MNAPAAKPQQQVPKVETAQPPAIPMPYVPTAEEEQYLLACAAAIVAGCEAATAAAKVGENSGQDFLNYANGVKSLTAAYIEIKTGGKAATGHQGA